MRSLAAVAAFLVSVAAHAASPIGSITGASGSTLPDPAANNGNCLTSNGSAWVGGSCTASGGTGISGTPSAGQAAEFNTSSTVQGVATTGSGSYVKATSPTLTTPTLGAATATSINKVTLTAPATGSTLTVANGKTLTVNNTVTLSGTDGSTLNIGSGGTLGSLATADPAAPPALGGTTPAAGSFSSLKVTGVTGSTQCLHADSTGAITGTGSDCGSGGTGASLSVANAFTATQRVVPYTNTTATGAVALDFTASNNVELTLTGNVTLSASNAAAGQVLNVQVKQDATGGRTLTFGTGFTVPTGFAIASAANAITQFSVYVDSSGTVYQVIGGVSTPIKVASGTAALGTSAISSGACATAVTATATGTATTDVIDWGFSGDPTAVTGYTPSTSGMLTVIAYPTADTVNFKVCNNTASSVTPGAITLNWKVNR